MMQIALLVLGGSLVAFGLRALITGKGMKLTKDRPLEGKAAKVAGAVVLALGLLTIVGAVFQDRLYALLI